MTIKSRFFAVAVTMAAASMFTLAQPIVAPAPAQAGVLGSIKSAAKSVGGAVSHAAKATAGGTKAVASGVYNKAQAAGGKIVGGVVKVGMANAKLISQTYPAKKIGGLTRDIVRAVQR